MVYYCYHLNFVPLVLYAYITILILVWVLKVIEEKLFL